MLENFVETPPAEKEVQIMDEDEQAQIGYFNVFKIVKHKFQQGWKFLVWWENFPVSASTWEPISSFVHPNGSVNSVFKTYCLDNGLTNILQKALSDNPSQMWFLPFFVLIFLKKIPSYLCCRPSTDFVEDASFLIKMTSHSGLNA